MPFQKAVHAVAAAAVAGDFASSNPRGFAIAGPGALIAGAGGVKVGLFAWAAAPADIDGTPSVVTNAGTGDPTGFVHREQQGLLTAYLDEASIVIPQGFGLELMTYGDVFAVNDGAAAATPGAKVWTDPATGKIAVGAATAGAFTVDTGWVCRSAGAQHELIKISKNAG